jgi:uncharacterized Zn finger protein (UPF0148 family)
VTPVRGVRRLADVENLTLAVELIRHHTRTPLVLLATGLSVTILRALHRDLHGRRPTSGKAPQGTVALLSHHGRHRHAALFATLYFRLMTGNDSLRLEVRQVLRVYQLYRRLAPADCYGIDFNVAWVIARDLRARRATLRHCPQCKSPFLLAAGLAPVCPVCRHRPLYSTPRRDAANVTTPADVVTSPVERSTLLSVQTVADSELLVLAVALLRHQARIPLVAAATGLPEPSLLVLYRDLHGQSPVAGQLRASASAVLRPYRRHLHATLFAALYQRLAGESDPRQDARRLLQAYERYRRLAPADPYGIDINTAWVIARDLRTRWVTLRRCPRCTSPYLMTADSISCPFCTPAALSGLTRSYLYSRAAASKADGVAARWDSGRTGENASQPALSVLDSDSTSWITGLCAEATVATNWENRLNGQPERQAEG